MVKPQKKSWRTVRCVVEYRTQAPTTRVTDVVLARYVQRIIDAGAPELFIESRLRAKSFSAVVRFIGNQRPRQLVAVARALEKITARLRKI